MNGLKEVAKRSRPSQAIFYDYKTKTVNTTGKGFYVTTLLRKNTEQEIEQAVNRFLSL